MEHLSHLILIAIGLSVGLIIWFWDGLKFRSLILLILLIFTLLHASPLSLTIAHHHLTSDQTAYHPCCMPQAATSAPTLTVPLPPNPYTYLLVLPVFIILLRIVFNINNRSPPILF